MTEALEVRAARLEDFKLTKQGLTISAQASAGVSATLRDAELISMLMKAISSDPKADLVALVDAGLTDEQIEAMQRRSRSGQPFADADRPRCS